MGDIDLEDYSVLLSRAKERLPQPDEGSERWEVPQAEVMIEGKTTVLRNLESLASDLRREPQEVFQFLVRELGTSGNIDGKRAIFKGQLGGTQVQERIKAYAETYVICHECRKPDTRLVKNDRILVMECEACGAHRSVRVRKGPAPTGPQDRVRAGAILEVRINDIGRKGDGIAKVGSYVIVVPGVAKGMEVRVMIDKVIRNMAYARLARDEK